MKRARDLFGALMLILVVAAPARAQFQNVGSIDFHTSATGEAQQHFLRGVAILHSFGWKQAIEQFHAAQALDPDFALAYWGESLAYNHPLFSQMAPEQPREALARLGPTPAARRAKAPTDREKGFLDAVEILWGEGDQVTRRVGYMEAMRRLYERYPDDSEVGAFYALSLLSAAVATRDLTGRLNVRAGAITLPLFEEKPDHPGAAHYTIHAFDDPIHAPLALEAANRFAEIAPAVSHARHMPTHIFIQHGMWDRVSANNESAYTAARELWEPGDEMGDAVHALDWGQYGELQRGDYERARLWIRRIETMAEEGGFLEGGPRGEAGSGRTSGAVSLLRSRYIVETEDWQVGEVTPRTSGDELLATALSAAHTGNRGALEQAAAALDDRARGGSGNPAIMAKQANALLHVARGEADAATRLMDEAVAIDEAMAPPRGAATPIKPVHELYGEILLELDRPARAVELFETSLLRLPNRPRSLLGLARAHARLGHEQAAAEAYGEVVEVWAGREALDGLQEARRYLESTMQR